MLMTLQNRVMISKIFRELNMFILNVLLTCYFSIYKLKNAITNLDFSYFHGYFYFVEKCSYAISPKASPNITHSEAEELWCEKGFH